MVGKRALVESNLPIEILETPSVRNLNFFNNTDFIFAATGSIKSFSRKRANVERKLSIVRIERFGRF